MKKKRLTAALIAFSMMFTAAMPAAMPIDAVAKKKHTIANVKMRYAVEATVKLSGRGTGYHTKLVLKNPKSAVSFGIQFDNYAHSRKYRSKAAFMIENVKSNNPGGQVYTWVGKGKITKSYRLLIAADRHGKVRVYINGKKKGVVTNKDLIRNGPVTLSVEGSARKKGDSIKTTFTNIKLKNTVKYDSKKKWNAAAVATNKGFDVNTSKYNTERKVTIKGVIKGISRQMDWDSAYNSVSGVVHYSERKD